MRKKRTRPVNEADLNLIRLLSNGEIDAKKFAEKKRIQETTADNYLQAINRFKKTGKRPARGILGKAFDVWADEYAKDHFKEEKVEEEKETTRKIKYKVELIVWEYM